MDLRQVGMFVAVAEELSFTRAAIRMHISQPPLSRHIARLEQDLGMRLLERDRQNVSLTPAGSAFLPQARRLLAIASEAPEIARRAAHGESGTIRIGFVHSTIYTSVPSLVKHFRKVYPKVDIKLHQLTVANQIEQLLADDLDIGILRHRLHHPEINVRLLVQEPLILALPADHPLSALKSVNLKLLANENFISFSRLAAPAFYEQLLVICQQAQFSPKVVMEAEPLSTVIGLVASGSGVAIVPQSMSRLRLKNVAYRKLTGSTAVSEFSLAWRSNNVSATVQNFLKVTNESANDF